jgi:hypothetical protein
MRLSTIRDVRTFFSGHKTTIVITYFLSLDYLFIINVITCVKCGQDPKTRDFITMTDCMYVSDCLALVSIKWHVENESLL